jgi:hypothetical protein
MEDYKLRDLRASHTLDPTRGRVYYESMKRNLLKPIYECRCNGRLQTKRITCLSYTGSVVELEHLKILLFIMNR